MLNMLNMNMLNALTDQRVIIREDFNVPINESGEITDDTRIQRALPLIRQAINANAKVMLLSHLGRPKEGEYDKRYSLAPVAKALQTALDQPVPLIKNWLDGVAIDSGQAVLAENVRFNVGEKANDAKLAQRMAALCDVFIMDAFATAHRAQASTVGIAHYATTAIAGPLLQQEIAALDKALAQPTKPLVAIIGGAKISTKIELLQHLMTRVDQLIIGGAMANTLLAAKGIAIGRSLYEADCLDVAKTILQQAQQKNIDLPLPVDVAVATTLDKQADATIKSIHDIQSDELILDIGTNTIQHYCELLSNAHTIVWNGPVGVFEFPAFATGTQALAQAIADSTAFSIAGGGDTVAAINQFGLSEKISYISTGGGAFLHYLEGKPLPGVAALQKR